jgi:hypothetical protein
MTVKRTTSTRLTVRLSVRSPSVRLVEVLIVLASDVGRALQVLVGPRYLKRLTHAQPTSGRVAFGVELRADAAPNRFRHRNGALLRPALEATILLGGELYLRSHHDVIIVA